MGMGGLGEHPLRTKVEGRGEELLEGQRERGGTGVGLEAMCTQNHVAPCFPKVQRGGALGIF